MLVVGMLVPLFRPAGGITMVLQTRWIRLGCIALLLSVATVAHSQCTPLLLQTACPQGGVGMWRSPLVPAPPARATSTNGRELTAAHYQGGLTFWTLSQCTSSFDLVDRRVMRHPCMTVNALRDTSPENVFRHSDRVASSISSIPWTATNHIRTAEISNGLAVDRSGSGREAFAFVEPSTGTVQVCEQNCAILRSFDFISSSPSGIAIPNEIKSIRLHYPHAVVVTRTRYTGNVAVHYVNVATGARTLLDRNAGSDATADVNDSIVVWSRINQNRYLFVFWRIGSAGPPPFPFRFPLNVKQVFPNACPNYDFRHPRLTPQFLTFVLSWLNTPPKAEIEAYSLQNLLAANTGEACIRSGDLVQWDSQTPWHEAWEDRSGQTTVSFYEKQSARSEPSVRATCWP
jgi:hypothetical protein